MVHRFLPAKGVFKLKIIWILCLYLIQNGMTQIPTFVSAYKIDSNPTEGTFDEEGNFYYFSNFILTRDFDPGPGVFHLSTPSVDIRNAAIVKINAAGDFVWAKQIVSNFNSEISEIKVDDSGNIFVTGKFQPMADFDPGPGFFNLSTAGLADIFVLKLDNEGSFLFAKKMGGTQFDSGISLTLDAEGNILTTGFFNGTADFNPSTLLEFELTSFGEADVFVSKLDGGGNFVWAKKVGGTGTDPFVKKIECDLLNNVYLTGDFDTTIDFNPSDLGVFNLTPLGESDIYILKLNSSGNFVWAKAISGLLEESSNDIKIDSDGNVYHTGSFSGTTDFNPGVAVFNMTALGLDDVFIVKLNVSGNFVWAKHIGSTGREKPNNMVLDASGNVYTTGEFDTSLDADPGPGIHILSNAGGTDLFTIKLNPTGELVWAIHTGSTFDDLGRGLKLNTTNELYTHGVFRGTVDFDPGLTTYYLISPSTSSFISRLFQPTIPLPVSLTSFTATCNSEAIDLYWTTASEVNNHSFTVEKSTDGIHFSPLENIETKGNSPAYQNYLYTDYSPSFNRVYYRLKQTDFDGKFTYSHIINTKCGDQYLFFSVFPNPTNDGRFTLQLPEDGLISIFDIQGKMVYNQKFMLGSHNIHLNAPSGVYLMTMTSKQYFFSERLIVP
ncbi:MAG: T9SS type A sorting domain-containing protein [Saprospiraceae bacterium]|nr:T9SS type A sorting domain-containing protein [Saprospiraceae bacterium]